MGIKKIQEEKTRDKAVFIKFRNDKAFSECDIDVKVTPIFCSKCNRSINGLYKHLGSRYGQVGVVGCDSCGSTIAVTDHDYYVYEIFNSVGEYRNPFIYDVEKFDIEMPVYKMNYSQLFLLNDWVFKKIEGIEFSDFHHKFSGLTDLIDVIKYICKAYSIPVSEIELEMLSTDERICEYPEVVILWFSLLKEIGFSDMLLPLN